jgi:hypothetical protein
MIIYLGLLEFANLNGKRNRKYPSYVDKNLQDFLGEYP